MTRSNTRIALTLTGLLATLLVSSLPLQTAFGEGGARRDVVHQENIKDAITHATDAVEHGKQGHAEKLVTHAEASLQHAQRGGIDTHVTEAIINLREAIEHGKAGHADVATKHAETAVTHLSQVK
jgi:Small metal-binding protein